ncbi:MAG: S41 family peptidase [Candidatus Omnitrophota bacterium]|jgi:carboxyl-terminal processing protease|nr:MAG: S41 family peptidase [Candidatus Omnitrophota bacterium]
MHKKIVVFIFLVAAVLTAVSLVCSGTVRNKKPDLFKQVQLFSDALVLVQTDYVDETNPKDIIYGAISGMISSLDTHSQFLDPDTYNELKVETEGKFGGLGIELTIKDGLLTIVTPIEDTPAWKAGIKPQDKIVKINDEITRDMNLTDAVKKLRGNPGEAVKISVLRESEKKILDFNIVRGIIKIKDIKDAKIIDNGIGYIRVVEFRENTARDFKSALDKLSKEGMNALILDLRNNPGGLLDVAVDVADNFLEKGKMIVYTKGRKPSQNLEFTSQNANALKDLPIVVIINEGSASGSEIVAAAFQDNKRAIILGTKSFGKGSVQTVIPLGENCALRLTTSRYFTPSGKQIHGEGVIPDIIVENGRKVDVQEPGVEGVKAEEIFEKIEKKEGVKKDPAGEYKDDTQLMRAIDILKALKIYEKKQL